MDKVCTQHILRLLQKIIANMFFRDSEHIGMGKCYLFPKNITISIELGRLVQVGENYPQFPPRPKYIPKLGKSQCENCFSFSPANVWKLTNNFN